MKLIIDIPDNLYKTINNDKYGVHEGRVYDIIRNGTPLDEEAIKLIGGMKSDLSDFYDDNDLTILDMAISALSENEGEFDGMNNGEAMDHILRKTFPRTIFIRGIDEYNKTKSIVYSEEWENEPYKAED